MVTIEVEAEPRSRKDTRGRWHQVASAPCEECGCPYDYSIEDPSLVWEAGSKVDDRCLDRWCDCHVIPADGIPFMLHFRSEVPQRRAG